MVTIMNNKFKNSLKIISIIIVIAMLSTGCKGNAPTGSDFEDIVYRLELNTGSEDAVSDDTFSEDDVPLLDANSSDLNNIEEESPEEDDKPTDPTYFQNWPELLNPNGFNINRI